MNDAIATVGSNALVLDTSEEKSLASNASSVETQVRSLKVENDIGYTAAAELLKRVKSVQKKVKEYWEPLRKSAKAAYDSVLEKKKAMTEPLDNAEQILKRKMSDYTLEQERIQREREAQLRKEAQAEADRKLEAALQMEAEGDEIGAEYAMAEAEVYDSYAGSAISSTVKPKAAGISMQKTWKIRSIDPGKVPISFNGVEIRPVDEAAVLRLIKASKGQIIIPGITFAEDYTVAARA